VLGVVITAALVINFCSAALAGVAVPLTMRRLRIDPAVAGTVVVTAVSAAG
jgi:magnesium transporter